MTVYKPYIDMMDRFDPNKVAREVPVAATFVPRRSPEFKAHTRVGHAKNAIACHRYGIRYDLVDNKWVEVERKYPSD